MPRRINEPGDTERLISAAAAVASVVASLVHLHFDPLVNPDGIAYLLAAQAWLDAGYAGAASVYPLPIYSILIAAVARLSGWSLLTSAHCLDVVSIALLIVGLQRLARAMGGGVRVQAIVVLLALLLPELNGFRSFVLRDFGYWACWAYALVALLRYAESPTARRGAVFFGWCIAGALFRVEALALAGLMPIALLFLPSRRAAAGWLYLSIAFGSAVALVWVAAQPASSAAEWFRETLAKTATLAAAIPATVRGQIDGFATAVLNPQFHDYAAAGVLGGLLAMIVVHVVNAASVPVIAVAALGVWRGALRGVTRPAAAVLGMALAIVIASLAAVLAARGIIQTRYAMPAGFLLLILASFAVDAACAAADPRALRRVYALAGFAAMYFVAEAAFGLANSKQHYLQAADWLAHNTPANARIVTNDPRVVYLANRSVDWRGFDISTSFDTRALRLDGFDYLAVFVSRRDPGARTRFADVADLRNVAQFDNGHGDAVVIYRMVPTISLGGGSS